MAKAKKKKKNWPLGVAEPPPMAKEATQTGSLGWLQPPLASQQGWSATSYVLKNFKIFLLVYYYFHFDFFLYINNF
jgi:hypothetical protein